MFSNKNKNEIQSNNKNETGSTSINLIGAGTVIEGDIRSNGDIRIDGSVLWTGFFKSEGCDRQYGNYRRRFELSEC